MSKMRQCLVCSRTYPFCGHCNKNNIVELWKNTYCSKECREIFNTCSNFEGGLISQKDAYDALKRLGVDTLTINKSVKDTVEKIMKYEPPKKVKEETKTDEEPKRKPRKRRTKKTEE